MQNQTAEKPFVAQDSVTYSALPVAYFTLACIVLLLGVCFIAKRRKAK